jgi:hypothetical protein
VEFLILGGNLVGSTDGVETDWAMQFAMAAPFAASVDLSAELVSADASSTEVIATVDDILTNPELLAGKTPEEIEAIIGDTPGWNVETLGQGSHQGQGWVLREYNSAGNATGRLIRWHPGGGYHGPAPYWRVSSGAGGKSGVIR